MRGTTLLCCFFILGICTDLSSQTEIKLNAEKIILYAPYVEARHGLSQQAFEEWKQTNKLLYTKELWYYSESFYVKEGRSKKGVNLDPANIDISRYEQYRLENKEAVVELPGFKDALVLLPASKLIYKP